MPRRGSWHGRGAPRRAVLHAPAAATTPVVERGRSATTPTRGARRGGAPATAGSGRGDRVVLMMRNRPDFHLLDLAAPVLGATPISHLQLVVAGAGAVPRRALPGADRDRRGRRVPRALPQGAGRAAAAATDRRRRTTPKVAPTGVQPATSCAARRRSTSTGARRDRSPTTLATVIYTSGTTGPPKGVMLTHYNIVCTAEQLPASRRSSEPRRRAQAVSYLPMAHIAERMSTPLPGGHRRLRGHHLSRSGQIAAYRRDVRPQIMFGVPRVWEKIHAGVQAALAADPDKKAKFDEAVGAAIPIVERAHVAGDRHRGAARHLGVPRRGRVLGRPRS